MSISPKHILILLLAAALGLAGCGQPAAPAPSPTPITMPEPSEAAAPPTPAPTPEPTPEPTPLAAEARSSVYTARLTLDRAADTVAGELWLEYVNNTGDTLYSLMLHLYPNSVLPGSMAVTAAALNGRMAYYEVERERLLRLPLAVELQPGESCGVYLCFDITLSMDYGLAWRRIDLLCPLPVAAAYAGGQWRTDAAPGQPGFSEPADYRLLLQGAAGLTVDTPFTPAGEGYFTAEAAEYAELSLLE